MARSITRRGMTLMEVVIVISITVLLLSLIFPVIVEVKRRAKESKSIAQMKQIHLALMLYVEGQEGPGPLGLGLPPNIWNLKSHQNLDDRLFTTGGSAWKAPGQRPVYTWMPPNLLAVAEGRFERWQTHLTRSQQNPVILLDETFSPLTTAFSLKTANGLYFDGHIQKKRNRSSLSEFKIWE